MELRSLLHGGRCAFSRVREVSKTSRKVLGAAKRWNGMEKPGEESKGGLEGAIAL